MSGPPRRVMISCGEASGDLYAAALAAELRSLDPAVEIFGFGGPRLAAAGADLDGDYHGFAVTGLTEALSVLPRSWRMLRTLRDAARTRRPDVFVAIDFPDFNLRLLPAMRALGIPVVYYISPQLWAWRAGRLKNIRRDVTRMLVIFPFEQALYERAGVPVEFVGHPLAELAAPRMPRETWLATLQLDSDRPVVALLPGSRANEVRRILPVLVDAVPRIAAACPGIQVVVARAPSLASALFTPLDRLEQSGIPVAVVEDATDDALAAADVVVTASGTATVQAALHGRPMVVVYRVSLFTYLVGRAVVRVPHYAMVNLVAGRRIVPELIQGDFTAAAVAREVVSLLTDSGRAATMRHDVEAVRAQLGRPGASRRAAEAVLAAARQR